MLSSPVYQLPVSDDELLIVGRITLMWAQLDFQLDAILTSLHKIDGEQFTAFFGRTMIGAKVQAVKAATKRASSSAVQIALGEMCDAISKCLTDRNLMTHGMWGWNWNEDQGAWESCAISHRKGQAFVASELPELHEKIVEAALKVDRGYYLLVWKTEPPTTRNRAFASAPFPPEEAPGGGPPRLVR